eukprot:gene5943-7402_t
MSDFIKSLINQSSFKWATRLDYHSVNFETINHHVVTNGLPLVLSNVTNDWNQQIFSLQWIKQHYSNLEITVRTEGNSKNTEHWTVGQYIDYLYRNSSTGNLPSSPPPNQQQHSHYQQSHNNNLKNSLNNIPNGNTTNSSSMYTIPSSFYYRKDIPCPPEWKDYIYQYNKIYPFLREKDVGDLVADLPKEVQPNSSHINIDGDDYWSPGQREVAGSIGHNLMVYTDNGATTYWFCTPSSYKEMVVEFWKEKTGSTIDNDSKQMFIPFNELSKSKFPVYVIEQKQGDLVLLPSGGVHQYLNIGGRSIKLSWNRITAQTLDLSYNYFLPIYKTIRKKEHFPIKSIAFYSFLNRVNMAKEYLSRAKTNSNCAPRIFEISNLITELNIIFPIVSEIVWSEKIDFNVMIEERKSSEEKIKLYQDNPHKKICYFCNSFIFNRAYCCPECSDIKVDICLVCISEGMCKHKSPFIIEYITGDGLNSILEDGKKALRDLLTLVEEKPDVIDKYTTWFPKNPNSVSPATIAYNQVVLCQEDQKATCHQCKLARPRNKIAYCHKEHEDNGKKRKNKKQKCQKKFCSQCLWNRYSIQLVTCLSTSSWECLFCQNKCNCSACNRKRNEHENTNNNNGIPTPTGSPPHPQSQSFNTPKSPRSLTSSQNGITSPPQLQSYNHIHSPPRQLNNVTTMVAQHPPKIGYSDSQSYYVSPTPTQLNNSINNNIPTPTNPNYVYRNQMMIQQQQQQIPQPVQITQSHPNIQQPSPQQQPIIDNNFRKNSHPYMQYQYVYPIATPTITPPTNPTSCNTSPDRKISNIDDNQFLKANNHLQNNQYVQQQIPSSNTTPTYQSTLPETFPPPAPINNIPHQQIPINNGNLQEECTQQHLSKKQKLHHFDQENRDSLIINNYANVVVDYFTNSLDSIGLTPPHFEGVKKLVFNSLSYGIKKSSDNVSNVELESNGFQPHTSTSTSPTSSVSSSITTISNSSSIANLPHIDQSPQFTSQPQQIIQQPQQLNYVYNNTDNNIYPNIYPVNNNYLNDQIQQQQQQPIYNTNKSNSSTNNNVFIKDLPIEVEQNHQIQSINQNSELEQPQIQQQQYYNQIPTTIQYNTNINTQSQPQPQQPTIFNNEISFDDTKPFFEFNQCTNDNSLYFESSQEFEHPVNIPQSIDLSIK